MSRGMSAQEQKVIFLRRRRLKVENDEVLLHAREKDKKQQAGSGKAAGRQEAAGRAGKRAKAKLRYKQKSDTPPRP